MGQEERQAGWDAAREERQRLLATAPAQVVAVHAKLLANAAEMLAYEPERFELDDADVSPASWGYVEVERRADGSWCVGDIHTACHGGGLLWTAGGSWAYDYSEPVLMAGAFREACANAAILFTG